MWVGECFEMNLALSANERCWKCERSFWNETFFNENY